MIFNPAIALISSFLYSLVISFSYFEFYFLLPLLFVLFFNRKKLITIFKKLLFLNIFIFVLFLVLLIESTFDDALNIYIRANSIILFNLALFFNSYGYDIVRGLRVLKFPSSFIATTYFSLKMIDYLVDDIKNIRNILKSRGFKTNTSLFTYEVFGNIFGMLFVKVIMKSQRLKDTFKARGFKGKIYLNDSFRVNKVDLTLVVLIFLMIIIKVCDELFF
ncbi:MAG: CbiQ family ECF transporter T component [Campylobacterota bacterium]